MRRLINSQHQKMSSDAAGLVIIQLISVDRPFFYLSVLSLYFYFGFFETFALRFFKSYFFCTDVSTGSKASGTSPFGEETIKCVCMFVCKYCRLSLSPSLLVSGSGRNSSSLRFALEKNFELDLWASLIIQWNLDKTNLQKSYGIMSDFLYPSNSKIYGKGPRYKDPRYSEHIEVSL